MGDYEGRRIYGRKKAAAVMAERFTTPTQARNRIRKLEEMIRGKEYQIQQMEITVRTCRKEINLLREKFPILPGEDNN